MQRLFYLALLFHHVVSQKLHVITGDVTAQLHDSVIIPCKVTGYNTPGLDLHNVGVKWIFRSPNHTEEEVYLYNGKEHSPLRQGSRILEEELKKGNASLFIPEVRLSEAGSYKCTIFVSSNKVEGTSSLLVLANPKVALSSSAISVDVGDERSLSCAISQFYPQSIAIQWFELSNGKLTNVATGICTGSLISNPDGTFNVTSRLRLRPSLEDNAKTYTCTVDHPSLIKNLSLTAELSVTEPREQNAVIIGCSFGFAIAAAVVIAFVVYKCYFKAVPPKLSVISMPLKLVHEETANISFQVTGFRPQNITVNCLLNDASFFQWRDGKPCIGRQHKHSSDNENIPLLDANPFHVKPVIEQHKDGTSSISCNIKTFPDLRKHDGASLSIQILHKALTSPLQKTVHLKVVGVAPRLSKILKPHPIVQNEDCILTCLISNFKPKPVEVTWYRRLDEEQVEVPCHKEGDTEDASKVLNMYSSTLSDVQFEDRSYCVTSTLKFRPTVKEHNNSIFVCKTVHDSTSQAMSRAVSLQITAVPVLTPIQHSPSMPRAGEEITLICKIHSFFPAQIEIVWCKDSILMNDVQQDNSTIAEEVNGLCYCVSKITFAPMKMDEGKKISCCVKHASLLEPKEVGWHMVPVTVPPSISEIYSDPPEPELGKPVTLTCAIAEFFPENCTVLWTPGENSADSKYETMEEIPTINQETGLFHMKTSITFIARREDHGKEIFLKVLHYATMNKPEERNFLFLLKGVPIASDIIVEPQCFGYGQHISFTGTVAGFHPRHITVGWYQSGRLLEGIKNMILEDERGFFNLTSTVALTLTALDYNKDISFRVHHRSLIQPIEKYAKISLQALPPTLSEIEIIPVEPEVNKLLTLRVVINDYAPGNIQVRWFKPNRCLIKEVSSQKPQIGRNGLCSSESQVQLWPSAEDHNSQLKCEVLHLETNKVIEKTCILKLKGCSLLPEVLLSRRSSGVLLDVTDGSSRQNDELCIRPPTDDTECLKIQCVTKNPKAGEEISFCCTIPHCHSNDTYIVWYSGIYPVNQTKIRTEDFEKGCTSYVTIDTARGDSKCEIRCEVMSEESRQEVFYTLKFI